jgi:hypothetical protein
MALFVALVAILPQSAAAAAGAATGAFALYGGGVALAYRHGVLMPLFGPLAGAIAAFGSAMLWLWAAIALGAAFRFYGLAWGVVLGSTPGGVIAGAAALLLGAVVIRTRSLLVVIAWHAAFNVAFYLVVACRPG